MSVPIDYAEPATTSGRRGRLVWPRLLIGYLLFSIAVCVFSVVGIRHAQKLVGYDVIFEDAAGTSFYDDVFVSLPGELLFYGAVILTGVGAWIALSWRRPMVMVTTVSAIWPAFVVIYFVMIMVWWENASP